MRRSPPLPSYLQQQADARKYEQLKGKTGAPSYELRGNNLAIQTMTDQEVVLVGAAGTGKTLGNLYKIDRLMREYPRLRVLIVRKVRADVAGTVLVTFERDILGVNNPICANMQRENRDVYRYPNGSEITIGGMDRPGRFLSGEYDLIYVPETVQLTESDWEMLVMRLRSNALPYQQILGDTNPDRPDHWLKLRADSGKLTLLSTFHRDNPAYWQNGDWTRAGRDYVLGKLASLSGVRRLRYLEGKWVLAEGAVYDDWNEAIHLIDPFPIPASWRRIRAIDFGFNNPFVCQWWAIDPDDRMYLYREIYMSRRIVADHAQQIKALSDTERYEVTVADHDAEDRATLARAGIPTKPARKEITVGVQAVQARLRPAGNAAPRLFVFRDALVEPDEELRSAKKPISTAGEFPGYVWTKTADGKPIKEVPLGIDDHGMDAMRYAVRYVDRPRQGAAETF